MIWNALKRRVVWTRETEFLKAPRKPTGDPLFLPVSDCWVLQTLIKMADLIPDWLVCGQLPGEQETLGSVEKMAYRSFVQREIQIWVELVVHRCSGPGDVVLFASAVPTV